MYDYKTYGICMRVSAVFEDLWIIKSKCKLIGHRIEARTTPTHQTLGTL